MILVITGNGKGKTTSALGTLIRASGCGKRAAVVFFDKGGSHYGEENILNLLQERIDTFRFGLKRFDEKTKKFRFDNTEKDISEVKKGIKKIFTLYKERYFLIVCDELITCLSSNLTDKFTVQDLLEKCPEETHLILTGRNAPKWLTDKADLVSEVNEVKHYFKKGIEAVRGLDY
jgi:cob(I)alamin adenosyltransferase